MITGRRIVYHIHADFKFAQRPSQLFPEEQFENRYVYLATQSEKAKPAIPGEFFTYNTASIEPISRLLMTADVVIFYSLNDILAGIVNLLPERIVVIWRFFGYELYDKLSGLIYSETTRRWIRKEARISKLKSWMRGNWTLKGAVRRLASLAQRFQGNRTGSHCSQAIGSSNFQKAVERTDFIAGLADTEYEFLSTRFHLPPFLQLPYLPSPPCVHSNEKDSTIILGHSRIMYGNHLDTLSILSSVSPKHLKRYQFKAFFSYGAENAYTREVRTQAARFETLHLIDDFMPLEEFRKNYDRAAALVIYAFRQVAMGNIFMALRAGAKVYLPEGNVMFNWLVREGFVLYDPRFLKSDLEQGTIYLSMEEMTRNRSAYENLAHKYTVAAFAEKIVEACNSRAVIKD